MSLDTSNGPSYLMLFPNACRKGCGTQRWAAGQRGSRGFLFDVSLFGEVK
jgi:hypothetical protein